MKSADRDRFGRPSGPPLDWEQPPAWRYLAQLPQGRKAARVSELFRVSGGPCCLNLRSTTFRLRYRSIKRDPWFTFRLRYRSTTGTDGFSLSDRLPRVQACNLP